LCHAYLALLLVTLQPTNGYMCTTFILRWFFPFFSSNFTTLDISTMINIPQTPLTINIMKSLLIIHEINLNKSLSYFRPLYRDYYIGPFIIPISLFNNNFLLHTYLRDTSSVLGYHLFEILLPYETLFTSPRLSHRA